MGRVIKTIEIEGQPAVALFDSGAVYTYAVERLLGDVPRKAVAGPVRVVLGGRVIDVQEVCTVDGKIEGLDFFTETVPVQGLGMADGRQLDAIIGARTMEQWEIRIDPKAATLDLDGLRRREFTEFSEVQRIRCLDRKRIARVERLARQSIQDHREALEGLAG